MTGLTVHVFKWAMSVMDGNRCVAVAKQTPHGWLLTMHGGCWLNPLARSQGLIPGKYPNLMLLPSRGATRAELGRLARASARADR